MSPVDIAIVQRKLGIIQRSIQSLDQAELGDLEQYKSDLWLRKGTERLLQEAIEAALDTASHLVVRAGRPAPADFYSSFLELAEVGAIDRELASALAPAAGLRNRLVHEYDDLDDGIVLQSTGKALELLPRFIAQVQAYLQRA